MKKDNGIELACPICKGYLDMSNEKFYCKLCLRDFQIIAGIPSFVQNKELFYEGIYSSNEMGKFWSEVKGDSLEGISKFERFLINMKESLNMSYKREKFFKKYLKNDSNAIILDLGCGGGRKYFREYGTVVGIDVIFSPLLTAMKYYDLVVHCNALNLPFPDDSFDYVVSSDFFGHIPAIHKDNLLSEIYRVLKSKGKTIHIIETDSNNLWFRFAHRYPELFRKYFIEEMGGHIGLEFASKVVERFKRKNFREIDIKKIWGNIWQIQEYRERFDNEFKQKSKFIKFLVSISNCLSKKVLIKNFCNIILNPISSITELFYPLDNGQGIMVCFEK